MKTHHTASPAERRDSESTARAVRHAVQEAMDRRDNGGETGH